MTTNVVIDNDEFSQFLSKHGICASSYEGSNVPRFIRLNPRNRPCMKQLEAELNDANASLQSESRECWPQPLLRPTPIDDYYMLPSFLPLSSLSAYRNQQVYGIDISSAIPVLALQMNVRPCDARSEAATEPALRSPQVLDICCAPGGKLAYAADLLMSPYMSFGAWPWDGRAGSVTGVDISPSRMAVCRQLLTRYAVSNARLFCADACLDAPPPPVVVFPAAVQASAAPLPPYLFPCRVAGVWACGDADSADDSAVIPSAKRRRVPWPPAEPTEPDCKAPASLPAPAPAALHDLPLLEPGRLQPPPETSRALLHGSWPQRPAVRHLPRRERGSWRALRARAEKGVGPLWALGRAMWAGEGKPDAEFGSWFRADQGPTAEARAAVHEGACLRLDGPHAELTVGDARAPAPASLYDYVMVDAECSHDGSVRHVEKLAKSGWDKVGAVCTGARVDALPLLQRRLLAAGWAALREGGTLVYSTCSFSVAQNESVCAWLVKEAGATIVDAAAGLPCLREAAERDYGTDPISPPFSGGYIPFQRGAEVEAVAGDDASEWKDAYEQVRSNCLRLTPSLGTSGLFICKFIKAPVLSRI